MAKTILNLAQSTDKLEQEALVGKLSDHKNEYFSPRVLQMILNATSNPSIRLATNSRLECEAKDRNELLNPVDVVFAQARSFTSHYQLQTKRQHATDTPRTPEAAATLERKKKLTT